jgi:two-component system, OmpR family, alkaline phosphatase synthesis response regulator PhoP
MEDARKFKILIIEDDPIIQKVYRDKLAIEGYDVDVASDGEEGMNKALNSNPDLVLLDLVLPKINGFYILSELRKNPRTQRTPIIILSNRGREDEIERGMKLGVDDYIVKIFATPIHVVERIQKHLSKRRARPYGAASLGRYRIVIQPSKYDALHLARDFGFNDLYSCNQCGTQLFLEITYDPTFSGSGNRFFAQFTCPRCSKIH